MKLQRCQHKEANSIFDLNIANGQHGKGVYCFAFGNKPMREFYSKNGENTYTFEIDDNLVKDLSHLNLDYWKAKTIIYNSPQFKAFVFKHKGVGIPTSKEILIVDSSIITNLKKES